jgi:hypothetical protein
MVTAWLWFLKYNSRDGHVIMHALSLIRVSQTRLVDFSNRLDHGTNGGTEVWGRPNLARSIDEVTT